MFKVLLARINRLGAPVSHFSTTQTAFKSYPRRRDHIIRGFTKNGYVRFSLVDCSSAVNTSLKNFNTQDEDLFSPLANNFAFNLLLSSLLKGEERVKSIISYPSKGQINTTYAESMANGEIRGFARNERLNPEKKHTPLLSVARVLYNQSSEYSTMLNLKQGFSGTVSEINDVVHEYFETSEQIPTIGNLHYDYQNNEPKSFGYLLQIMPGCPENYLKDLHKNYFEKSIWPSILENQSLDINRLQLSLNDLKLEVEMNRYPVDFHCRCKKEDYINVLKTIDAGVIVEMKEKNENQLNCMYCNKTHTLEETDFDHILKEKADSQKIETN